jgi:hypothetical protein
MRMWNYDVNNAPYSVEEMTKAHKAIQRAEDAPVQPSDEFKARLREELRKAFLERQDNEARSVEIQKLYESQERANEASRERDRRHEEQVAYLKRLAILLVMAVGGFIGWIVYLVLGESPLGWR